MEENDGNKSKTNTFYGKIPNKETLDIGIKVTLRIIPILFKYCFSEIKNHLCYYFLSLLSLVIAILIALCLSSIIYNCSLIFLKMSEIAVGEKDASISAKCHSTEDSSFEVYLDYEKIMQITKNKYSFNPRMEFTVSLLSLSYLSKINLENITYNESKDLFKLSDNMVNKKLVLINLKNEKASNFGTTFPDIELTPGDITIPESVALKLGYKVGDKILLGISFSVIFEIIAEVDPTNVCFDKAARKKNKDACYSQAGQFSTFKVKYLTQDNGGKSGNSDSDSFLYVDYESFFDIIGQKIYFTNSNYTNYFKSLKTVNYASYLVYNLINRKEIYANPDFYQIQENILKKVSNIYVDLGYSAIAIDFPILKYLSTISYANTFFGIIIGLVVVILACTSIFLIYSLLMISVESKAFDFALFRMLGITKSGLALLIIVHSIYFIIPSLIIGFSLSFLILFILNKIFLSMIGVGIPLVPSGLSILWAVILSVFVPILATILPIRFAFQQRLIVSIERIHLNYSSILSISKESKNETNWSLVSFGTISVVYGFLIYYLLPSALISGNLNLMLWIFLTILIALLTGFALLSLSCQTLIEKIVGRILIFWESNYVFSIVMKNLISHKIRNRRTSILYTIILGFLIFIICEFNMQIQILDFNKWKSDGSYFHIYFSSEFNYSDLIILEKYLESDKNIMDWGYVSKSINNIIMETNNGQSFLKQITLSDFGDLSTSLPITINSVSPNFWETILNQYGNIFESNESSGLPYMEQLYRPTGTQRIVSSSYVKSLFSDLSPDNTLIAKFEGVQSDTILYLNSILLADSVPLFSQISSKNQEQTILISMPSFEMLLNNSFLNLEFMQIIVKFYDNSYDKIKDTDSKITNYMYTNNVTKSCFATSLSDPSNPELNTVSAILNLSFDIIIIIFMALGGFSLFSTMTANVLDQIKEIAVMRALGITKCRMFCIYMYESIVIILSSSLIGFLIGFVLGESIIMQNNLFNSQPISFIFPWLQALVIFVFSIICGILSIVYPIIKIIHVPISDLLKN